MRGLLAAALALPLAAPALAQAPAAASAALTRIGAAGGVLGKVQAQAPGAPVGRVVESGKPIFLEDHVTTDASGRLQVLLLDETVFTLGPNSDMVLDRFVYDPNTRAGEVAARVTRGVFRFVTGRVAGRNPASMNVRLPSGTIGIRGTIVVGEASDDHSTAILAGPGGDTNTDESAGAIIVENAGVSRFVSKPGRGVTIRPGEPPSKVQDLSALADRLQAQLETPIDLKAQNVDAGGDAGPGKQSGQSYVENRLSPTAVLDQQQSGDEQQQVLSDTAQDAAVVTNVTQWQQLLQITTGSDDYSGTGTLTCSGCLQATTADFTYKLNIDFANRTIGGTGGNGSNIVLDPSGSMDLDNTTTNINAIAFGSAGNAIITLKSADLSDANFAGTKITLKNGGGIIARDSSMDLKYVNTQSGYDVTGSGSGSRGSAPTN